MRTMGAASEASGLEVSSLAEDNFLELPDVFTRRTIPISRENIPRQKDLRQWSYLKDVHIPEIDAEVGLLIGCNAYKAMEPWEVMNSVNDGPYAVRTRLGWTVNGPLKEHVVNQQKGKTYKVTANRISIARLDDLWQQQFKLDFPERGKDKQVEMSREDHRFMDMVLESAKLVDRHYIVCLPLKNQMVNMPNNRKIAEQ